MSKDSAKLFIEKLREDKDFRQKTSTLSSADDVLAFAKENGYDFTENELQEAAQQVFMMGKDQHL
ncbi:MAG: Nif11-like leader peptide family natural product precursor [Waddliaceae bacterium]|jgi:predicted ribosomally synthesized peptide with nif11-like leader|nr:Nif11-like leader peptide family natural product precursor [Waddliaceae bacterium]MBT3579400.1 Nif11-like leader peptide family natural product precursor [Waddliaceae bacterium]MBT4444620.1 Nif11-like leader peptide family natural product precursor [Waddliaceae bacterium]MBT6928750.1 Nif11-like leader peptide family natural product precursor [Waddliaceae bacterium]MBT7264218.1 Nif11-like leader peptide family natural product precursor [Waddliaceae bacterium]